MDIINWATFVSATWFLEIRSREWLLYPKSTGCSEQVQSIGERLIRVNYLCPEFKQQSHALAAYWGLGSEPALIGKRHRQEGRGLPSLFLMRVPGKNLSHQ